MNHLFDYPPFPPIFEPNPELQALLTKTHEQLKNSKVAVITAKEGGGTRKFVAGVDNYLSIYHTTPRTGELTMQVGKHRGHGHSPEESLFVYDLGKFEVKND